MGIGADIDEQSRQVRAFTDPQRTALICSARAMDALSFDVMKERSAAPA